MIFTGLVSVSFRNLSPKEIIEHMKESGLTSVEWGGDIHVPHGDTETARLVRKMTEEAGIKIAAYGSYYYAGVSEENGLSFNNVIASAIELRAPVIRVWSGKKGSIESGEEYWNKVVQDLKRIGYIALRNKISISLEHHNNTLTDSNESCSKLMKTLMDSNIKFYWQPLLGNSLDYNIEGIKLLLPRITNIHVYHWNFEEEIIDRRELIEGKDDWLNYLQCFKESGGDHHAMLEFVKDDDPEQLKKDAKTLNGIIKMIYNTGKGKNPHNIDQTKQNSKGTIWQK